MTTTVARPGWCARRGAVLAGLVLALACGSKGPECDNDGDGRRGFQCNGRDCDDWNAAIGECGCGEECQAGACVDTKCVGAQCGDDGCGGSCGECSECGTTCQYGTCVFDPCNGRECGDDGCGGSCGVCPSGSQCESGWCRCVPGTCGVAPYGCQDCDAAWGTCVGTTRCECTPACGDHACGDDGCGGSCGACNAWDICLDGACVPYDMSTVDATHLGALHFRLAEAVDSSSPCWTDQDGDGALDPGFWDVAESLLNQNLDLEGAMYSELLAGRINRLLLIRYNGGDTPEVSYAWAQDGDGFPDYAIEQTDTYGHSVAPVRLGLLVPDGATFTTPTAADLWFFDTAVMREGEYDSEPNALYLALSYIPIRDAVVTGRLAESAFGATFVESGVLRGIIRKEDTENAVWLAQSNCAESGHGSGTCAALQSTTSGWISNLFGWGLPGRHPDGTTPFCVEFGGTSVNLADHAAL